MGSIETNTFICCNSFFIPLCLLGLERELLPLIASPLGLMVMLKVFVKEGDRVNGKESCTSVDNSIVLRPASSGVNGDSNIFAQLMKAKITERKISAFRCWMLFGLSLHSNSLHIGGPIETPQIYTVASAPTTEPAPEPRPEPEPPPGSGTVYVQTRSLFNHHLHVAMA